MGFLAIFLIGSLFIQCRQIQGAYYIPGVTPTSFQKDDVVILNANKVTSTKTPIQYDYYDLPFCKRSQSRSKAENLGERLSGDSLTRSPYEVFTHYTKCESF